MNKPYATFLFDLSKAGKAKAGVYRNAFDGHYGADVKHTLFGLGDFDLRAIDNETLRSVRTMALFES
jgi:hypothetical protein